VPSARLKTFSGHYRYRKNSLSILNAERKKRKMVRITGCFSFAVSVKWAKQAKDFTGKEHFHAVCGCRRHTDCRF
jgi:hypothetical protein